MPRYFFTVTGADILAEDDVGDVFDDPIEARFAAERIARDLAKTDSAGFKDCSVHVRDESGVLIATVVVSDNSTIHRPLSPPANGMPESRVKRRHESCKAEASQIALEGLGKLI
jgi:hypothetical protein